MVRSGVLSTLWEQFGRGCPGVFGHWCFEFVIGPDGQSKGLFRPGRRLHRAQKDLSATYASELSAFRAEAAELLGLKD